MADAITITRRQKRGAYADIIDFLDAMAKTHTFANATHATATLLRSTKSYQDWHTTQATRSPTRQRKAG